MKPKSRGRTQSKTEAWPSLPRTMLFFGKFEQNRQKGRFRRLQEPLSKA